MEKKLLDDHVAKVIPDSKLKRSLQVLFTWESRRQRGWMEASRRVKSGEENKRRRLGIGTCLQRRKQILRFQVRDWSLSRARETNQLLPGEEVRQMSASQIALPRKMCQQTPSQISRIQRKATRPRNRGCISRGRSA